MTRSFLVVPSFLALLLVVPSTALAEEASPSVAPTPAVVLSADAPDATLERRVGTVSPLTPAIAETGLLGIAQRERVCVAPCGVRVDTRYLYRVSGDGLVPTASFAVSPAAERVEVDAKLGSSPWRAAGAVTAGLGALGVLAGGAALGVSPILAHEDVGSSSFRTAVVADGAATLAMGVLALGAGLYAFLSNGSSVRVGPPAPAALGARGVTASR